MNRDQIKGKAREVSGKIKREAGEVTGNERLANDGLADQVAGAVQQSWGDLKDAAHEVAESHREERQHKTEEMRDNIANKVEDAQENYRERVNKLRDQLRRSA